MQGLRQFTRNTLIYLSSNVARASLPFLLLPFLARALGTEEYGKIGLVAAAYPLMLVVVGVGTQGFIRANYHRLSDDELHQAIGNTALIVIAAGLLMFAALAPFADQFDLLPGGGMYYLCIATCAAIGHKFIEIRLALWQMAQKPLNYGALSIGLTVCNLAISILLVFVVGLLAEGRLIGMWLPPLLVGPLMLVAMGLRGEARFSPNRALLRRALSFGVPLIPHSLAISGIVFVERFALSGNADSSLLGLYFAAFQLSLPITILSNSVNLQFRAWSDPKMEAGRHRAVVIASYLLMLALLVAALAYAWLLQFLYTPLLGEAFAPGYPVSVILILSAMFRGWYLIVSKGLFFASRTRLLMAISTSLAIFFSAILLLVDSLYGVAYLNLGFGFMLFLCTWIATARVCPQPWLRVFTGRA